MNQPTDRRAELALAGLVRLLEHSGEARWLMWARGHLKSARAGLFNPTVLDAYGGPGSFNDLVLDPANGHALEQQEVPWANRLLAILGERIYQLAVELTDERFTAEWVRPADPPVEGWRCLSCGHGEIRDMDIEWFVARILVPAHVADSTLEDPAELVATLLSGQTVGAAESRADVMKRATASGVQIAWADGVMNPCPSCESPDTVRYRWIFAGGGLHPADDNLEVQRSGQEYRPATGIPEVAKAAAANGAVVVSDRLWHLGPHAPAPMIQAQTEILDIVRGLSGPVYLAIYEQLDISEHDGWTEVGEHTWLVPDAIASLGCIQQYLEAGAWQIYVADAPIPETQLPDLFKLDAEALGSALDDVGVRAMIDAWHDNTEWRIGVALSGS